MSGFDEFIIFHDEHRFCHFGWSGAFCGAPVSDYNWPLADIVICPRCLDGLAQGSSHIFTSPTSEIAICGALRGPERPLTAGVDAFLPELCDRCWTLDRKSVRFLEYGVRLVLVPGIFRAPVPTP